MRKDSYLSKIATDWINQYVGQYMQKYVPRIKKIKNVEIKNVEVLDEENQYVQIDFDLKTTKKESNYFLENDWGIKDNPRGYNIVISGIK